MPMHTKEKALTQCWEQRCTRQAVLAAWQKAFCSSAAPLDTATTAQEKKKREKTLLNGKPQMCSVLLKLRREPNTGINNFSRSDLRSFKDSLPSASCPSDSFLLKAALFKVVFCKVKTQLWQHKSKEQAGKNCPQLCFLCRFEAGFG